MLWVRDENNDRRSVKQDLVLAAEVVLGERAKGHISGNRSYRLKEADAFLACGSL